MINLISVVPEFDSSFVLTAMFLLNSVILKAYIRHSINFKSTLFVQFFIYFCYNFGPLQKQWLDRNKAQKM